MKTPMALSVTSSQREQTSLRFQVPRLPRSNVCSTRDPENPSASVHRKRFSTPSLTLKFLCAGQLNPRYELTELNTVRVARHGSDVSGLKWELQPFGNYVGPIPLFRNRYQASLARLFRARE